MGWRKSRDWKQETQAQRPKVQIPNAGPAWTGRGYSQHVSLRVWVSTEWGDGGTGEGKEHISKVVNTVHT